MRISLSDIVGVKGVFGNLFGALSLEVTTFQSPKRRRNGVD